MKKKISILVAVLAIGVMAFGMLGSGAFFVDPEVSQNNTFVAGTLDLKVNGGDAPVTMFNVSNMAPDAHSTGSLTLKNAGSIAGNLSISSIVLTSYEYGCWEPEIESHDTTCGDPGVGAGELQNIFNLCLYIDNDLDGSFNASIDTMLYRGMLRGLPASIPVKGVVAAGESVRLNYDLDWWDTLTNDNLAQSDGVKLDMTFRLAQQNH
jgi:hypothetical protein